ncbi:hypothetical protein K438DRAFT_1790757 [Mycena galopus ATCC 62051]|nr:hypothetical protein K438DRAFT_1790757 [Mycena galopus ATCC 62051]
MSGDNAPPITSQEMEVDADLPVDWSSKTVTPASTPKNDDLLAPPEGIDFDNIGDGSEGHTRSASTVSGGEDERSTVTDEARQRRDEGRTQTIIAEAYNARDEARAEQESLCVEIVTLKGTIEVMQDKLFQAKVEAVAAQRGEASARLDLKETRAENARLISRVSVLETDVAWKDNRLRSWADELDAYAEAEMKANQSGRGAKRQRNTYGGVLFSPTTSNSTRGSSSAPSVSLPATSQSTRGSPSVPSAVSTPAVETMVLPHAMDYGEIHHNPKGASTLITTTVDSDILMGSNVKPTDAPGRVITNVLLLPSAARGTTAALGGRHVEFDMKVPPLPVQHSNLTEGFERGFPATEAAWYATHKLQLHDKYFVYGLRHFLMWVYGRAIPPNERTDVQRLAIERYVMPDWFANTLSAVGWNHGTDNQNAQEFWKTLRRDDIGYDPAMWLGHMQYRELEYERGCRPIDDALTFNLRLGRGYNLFASHGMESPTRKPEHAPLRAQRIHLDKLLLQVIGTPGLYAQRRRELQIPIASTLQVKRWPIRDGANITLDDVVRRFAEGGIPETIVDDAFGFAQSFARDPGPLPKDMDEILSYADGYTVLPPPYFPAEYDPYPVSPFLPSQQEFINIAKFDLSNWALPELVGLRWEQYSEIAHKIANTPRKEVLSTGMVAKHNPYLKARTAAVKAMAQEQKLNAQARRHAPAVARIQARGPPRPTYQGQDYGFAAGLDASIHNPNAGLSSYDPFAANSSLRVSNTAKETGTPMCVDPREVMGEGSHSLYTRVPSVDDPTSVFASAQ